jgi:endogenous inhibitor of DNA gyrase (YacG/DUF329 family)
MDKDIFCEWDDYSYQDGVWCTTCYKTFDIENMLTPKEIGFKYCPFCSKKIKEIKLSEKNR